MKIEEIEKICDAATPGPWDLCDLSPTELWMPKPNPGFDKIRRYDDAKFMVVAREIMPTLIEVFKAAKIAVYITEKERWEAIKQLKTLIKEIEDDKSSI